MTTVFIDKELSQRHNLSMLSLSLLHPDERLYSLMLIQPAEDVDAAADYVRNKNAQSAYQKYKHFLRLAHSENIDLVLSPEYSCPWRIIAEAIQTDCLPKDGKLWVLGCESIQPVELRALANQYQNVIWIYEDLTHGGGFHFLDPVCYIFRARDIEGKSRSVIVVQFKGQPMADHEHYFERDNLILGTTRYILRNNEASIYLTALICSDALAFDEKSLPEYSQKPYLILHPQLNRDPRYNAFKTYRQEAYINNREEHEFVCLNWARGFKVLGHKPSPFGGSAYYTKSNQLNLRDDRINVNHQKGLYYLTCPDHRSHIYLFNYDEHVFYLRTTKPSQRGAKGVLQRKTGPEMLEIFRWDAHNQQWLKKDMADDGFKDFCMENFCMKIGETGNGLAPLSDEGMSPINKERLLALSNGMIKSPKKSNWFEADQLNFFKVKEDEIIKRMTVTQDPYHGDYEEAHDQRFRNMDNYIRLKSQIITNPGSFPDCLKDFSEQCRIEYPVGEHGYNYNLSRDDGQLKATVVFLGSCLSSKPERVYDELASILKEGKRQLVVWYEQNGKIDFKCRPQKPCIDEDLSEDERSITRVD